MQFGITDLVENSADPTTGRTLSPRERLRQVVELAVFVEDLGFDAFGVGERHSASFLSSSTPLLLGVVAERTEHIRLLPTVAVLPVSDPVRLAEDYATLDILSGSRVDIVIGKGNDRYQMELFGLTPANQWELLRDNYEILRDLLRRENVSAVPSRRPELREVTTYPRPIGDIAFWHGSASSPASALLAAENGDNLFTANALHRREVYATLVDLYRSAWVENGHGTDSQQATVASGAGFFHVAPTSQAAREQARPYFEGYLATGLRALDSLDFQSLDEWIDEGPALIGSPAEVAEKLLANHAAYGHVLQFFDVHNMKLPEPLVRASLELFASDCVPVVRAEAPGRAWPVETASAEVSA